MHLHHNDLASDIFIFPSVAVIHLKIIGVKPSLQMWYLRDVMQLPAIVESGATMVNDCANGRQGD